MVRIAQSVVVFLEKKKIFNKNLFYKNIEAEITEPKF